MKFINLPVFGMLLVLTGTLGFIISVILSFTVYSGMDHGALPAASFLSIMLGVAFAFPSMLQDTSGGVSTMRVITFSIVVLFCTIYFKIGWTVSKFEDFTIDRTWIYILGLAFGSKVFQRFGEEDTSNGQPTTTKEKQVTIKETTNLAEGEGGKNTVDDVSK